MKPAVLALFASLTFAAPVAANSLSLLLPTLIFPTETVTTSTKGCADMTTRPVCELAE